MSKIFNIPLLLIHRHYNDESDLPDYRTQFMRDRDRVMYCTAFRRLSGKTQIYTIGSDDHKKNRLTHSLEVSQIARTITQALGLNSDLAEAIALAHDFGHTPFGHAGERMLHDILLPNSHYVKNSPYFKKTKEEIIQRFDRECKKDYKAGDAYNLFGFKHNLQSVRVACLLEDCYRGNDGENIGLNLTNYTLWGMMHHSDTKYDKDDSFPDFQNRFVNDLIVQGKGDAWSFEAYIVRIADDIAQWHHDLEDAIRGEAISISELCETVKEALRSQLSNKDIACLDEIKTKENKIDRKCIADISHIVVNTLVNDLVQTSRINLSAIEKHLRNSLSGQNEITLSEMLYSDYDSIGFEKEKSAVITLSNDIDTMQFKKTIKEWVHHSRNVERMNEKGKYIIRKLFEAYYAHPQQLPDGQIFHYMVDIKKYPNIDKAKEAKAGKVRMEFDQVMKNPLLIEESLLMRRICDHIASMTDHYAIEEYNNLYG